jgi:hypothetical protein
MITSLFPLIRAVKQGAIFIMFIAACTCHAKESNFMSREAFSKKVDSKLTFSNDLARKFILDFNIDCARYYRGRVVPLVNLLISRAEINDWGYHIDSRGDEYRIYLTYRKGGEKIRGDLAFDINKWGEIAAYGMGSRMMFQDACMGNLGKIWINI